LLKKGRDSVVAIFSHMQPESAALQLSAMRDDVAAAVLSKLSPRDASAILNEIDPPRAARLTDVMAGNTPSAPEAKKAL
jgi:flagellar motility protein MotE (MotC chaperone)